MKWAPKLVYDASTLTLSLPQRPWTPAPVLIGGAGESAAGIREAFVIREDEELEVRLRFTEAEWSAVPGVRAWLTHAQRTAEPFSFYPDAAQPTFYACYLVSPQVGEAIRPERGEYPGTYEITVRLRRTTSAPITAAYYG